MIVRRALKNSTVVAGGGAIDVSYLWSPDMIYYVFMECNLVDIIADGDKPIFETACSGNCWKVTVVY